MRSLKISLRKTELLDTLRVLGSHRRRRFKSVVPVWLRYDRRTSKLHLGEDHGQVLASIPAEGEWPAVGATVDLLWLRKAAMNVEAAVVELHAVEEAVMVPTARGHVLLDLLPFGPAPNRATEPASGRVGGAGDQHSDLPLFRWAGNARGRG